MNIKKYNQLPSYFVIDGQSCKQFLKIPDICVLYSLLISNMGLPLNIKKKITALVLKYYKTEMGGYIDLCWHHLVTKALQESLVCFSCSQVFSYWPHSSKLPCSKRGTWGVPTVNFKVESDPSLLKGGISGALVSKQILIWENKCWIYSYSRWSWECSLLDILVSKKIYSKQNAPWGNIQNFT